MKKAPLFLPRFRGHQRWGFRWCAQWGGRLKSQSGQVTIEAVLIMVVLLGVFTLVSKHLKDNDFLKTLVQGPWVSLAGMIENGVWGSPQATVAHHPVHFKRHVSLMGETTN